MLSPSDRHVLQQESTRVGRGREETREAPVVPSAAVTLQGSAARLLHPKTISYFACESFYLLHHSLPIQRCSCEKPPADQLFLKH